jgi:hypothetical protein
VGEIEMLQSGYCCRLQWSYVDYWVSAEVRDQNSHKSWISVTVRHINVLLIEIDVVGITDNVATPSAPRRKGEYIKITIKNEKERVVDQYIIVASIMNIMRQSTLKI